jgi:hypothetical protein
MVVLCIHMEPFSRLQYDPTVTYLSDSQPEFILLHTISRDHPIFHEYTSDNHHRNHACGRQVRPERLTIIES